MYEEISQLQNYSSFLHTWFVLENSVKTTKQAKFDFLCAQHSLIGLFSRKSNEWRGVNKN